jgi:uncharacterized membrane protein
MLAKQMALPIILKLKAPILPWVLLALYLTIFAKLVIVLSTNFFLSCATVVSALNIISSLGIFKEVIVSDSDEVAFYPPVTGG